MSDDSIVLRELSNAQAYAKSDPPAALSKIRFVAEALTDIVATRAGAERQPADTQEMFLRRLEQDGVIASPMARRLHDLRIIGNKGVHEMSGTSEDAFNAIASARLLTNEVLGIRIAAPSELGPRQRGTTQSSVADRLKLMGKARPSTPDSGIKPLPLAWRDLFALAPGKSGIVLFFVVLTLALAALFVAVAAPVVFVRELLRSRAGALAGNLAGTATLVAELMVLGWVVSAGGTTRLWRAAIAPPSFAAGIFALWLLALAMTEIAGGLGRHEAAPPVAAQTPAQVEHVAAPEAMEPSPATSPMPSFSCTSTLSYVEQQICASSTLAELDQQLAAAYQERLATRSGADRAALTSEQRAWLGERGACGDAACIEGAYRHRLWMLSGPQPESPPVSQQSADLIEQPKWTGLPGSDFISTYYPPRALRLRVEGTAVITCLVTEKGELHTCEVLSEVPQGYGFGDAALGLASYFRLNPSDLAGQPVGGRSIQVPIAFKPPVDRPQASLLQAR
jgi:TonB family protein